MNATVTQPNTMPKSPDIRPSRLSEIVGQKNVVELLKVMKVSTFRVTGVPMSHMVFLGLSGSGKTTLAKALANEIGVPCHVFHGASFKTEEDVIRLISNVGYASIVFVDEMHNMSNEAQNLLLTTLEDFKLPTGQINRFTMIGATTDVGKMFQPFVNRFEKITLAIYSQEELSFLVKESCRRAYGLDLPESTSKLIAKLCRNSPRIANQMLGLLIDVAHGTIGLNIQSSNLSIELLRYVLNLKSIDQIIGLDMDSRQYLVKLLAQSGKPVGIKTLCTLTGQAEDNILNNIEPFLISSVTFPVYKFTNDKPELKGIVKGPLINVTSRGRIATEVAQKYLDICIEAQKSGNYFLGEILA